MKYAVILTSFLAVGCSDDESSPADDGTSSSGSGGETAGTGGSGGGAGGTGTGGHTCSEPMGSDPSVPKPTPSDIQFQALAALPKGEQLVFNDWNAFPNTLYSIRADGNDEIEVLRAYRIWSLGASNAGDTLAFTVTNSNPTLLRASTVGNALVLDYHDDQTGTAKVTVRATDGDRPCSSLPSTSATGRGSRWNCARLFPRGEAPTRRWRFPSSRRNGANAGGRQSSTASMPPSATR